MKKVVKVVESISLVIAIVAAAPMLLLFAPDATELAVNLRSILGLVFITSLAVIALCETAVADWR